MCWGAEYLHYCCPKDDADAPCSEADSMYHANSQHHVHPRTRTLPRILYVASRQACLLHKTRPPFSLLTSPTAAVVVAAIAGRWRRRRGGISERRAGRVCLRQNGVVAAGLERGAHDHFVCSETGSGRPSCGGYGCRCAPPLLTGFSRRQLLLEHAERNKHRSRGKATTRTYLFVSRVNYPTEGRVECVTLSTYKRNRENSSCTRAAQLLGFLFPTSLPQRVDTTTTRFRTQNRSWGQNDWFSCPLSSGCLADASHRSSPRHPS